MLILIVVTVIIIIIPIINIWFITYQPPIFSCY